LRSAANLNIHLQCLMLDGVCERGAAGPGQYEAAVPAVLKLKTPWHDGTRHLATSPLKFMQGVAVLVPRQHRPIGRSREARTSGCFAAVNPGQ